jgi:hypothetical protein
VGQIRIRGVGKKTTQVIVLSSEQRDAVEAAFAGYLSDYEEQWRAGDLDDYLLVRRGALYRARQRFRRIPSISRETLRWACFTTLNELLE